MRGQGLGGVPREGRHNAGAFRQGVLFCCWQWIGWMSTRERLDWVGVERWGWMEGRFWGRDSRWKTPQCHASKHRPPFTPSPAASPRRGRRPSSPLPRPSPSPCHPPPPPPPLAPPPLPVPPAAPAASLPPPFWPPCAPWPTCHTEIQESNQTSAYQHPHTAAPLPPNKTPPPSTPTPTPPHQP